jgi:type I restriction enzyme S subunit
MSKIEEMILRLCPEGVRYKQLGELCSLVTKQTGFDYSNSIKPSLTREPEADSLPYLQTRHFSGKEFNYNTEFHVPKNIWERFPKLILDSPVLLISIVGSLGNVGLFPGDKKCFLGGAICIARVKPEYNISFIYHYMLSPEAKKQIRKVTKGSGQATITIEDIRKFEIPIPPLPVQEEIVRVLDTFTELQAELQAELQKRLQQYNYYRDNLLSFEGRTDVVWMKLGDIGTVCMCKRIMKDQTSSSGDVPFFKIGTFGGSADAYIPQELFEEYKRKYSYPNKGDILISAAGTIGRTVVFDGSPSYFQDSNIVWLKHDESVVLNSYLRYCYAQNPWAVSTGGTIARLYNNNILNAVIPVPSLAEQQKIVDILDRFDTLTTDLSQGLPAEIEKRRQQYEFYRDKLLTFKRKEA